MSRYIEGKAPLVLHVGQPKTGTTFVQRWLAGRMHEPLAITYPLRFRRDVNQNSSVVDLFYREVHPSQAFTAWLAPVSSWNRERIRGAWEWLVRTVDNSALPVVVSSELLAFAGSGTARRIVQAFRPRRTVVVIGTRAVSGLIPSWFQQMGKELALPPFEEFARSVLEDLLESPATSPSAWMSAWHLRQTWSSLSDQVPELSVELVQTSVNRPRAVLAVISEVVGNLELARVDASLDSTENVSMPATAVELWQCHQRRFGTSAPVARHRTLMALISGHFGFPNVSLDHLRISPDVARLVDSAFPADGSPGSHVAAWNLRDRLLSGTPVTAIPDAADYARFQEQSAAILARMATHQRRMNTLYAAWPAYRTFRELTRKW